MEKPLPPCRPIGFKCRYFTVFLLPAPPPPTIAGVSTVQQDSCTYGPESAHYYDDRWPAHVFNVVIFILFFALNHGLSGVFVFVFVYAKTIRYGTLVNLATSIHAIFLDWRAQSGWKWHVNFGKCLPHQSPHWTISYARIIHWSCLFRYGFFFRLRT